MQILALAGAAIARHHRQPCAPSATECCGTFTGRFTAPSLIASQTRRQYHSDVTMADVTMRPLAA
jgi:hypothetical protein